MFTYKDQGNQWDNEVLKIVVQEFLMQNFLLFINFFFVLKINIFKSNTSFHPQKPQLSHFFREDNTYNFPNSKKLHFYVKKSTKSQEVR